MNEWVIRPQLPSWFTKEQVLLPSGHQFLSWWHTQLSFEGTISSVPDSVFLTLARCQDSLRNSKLATRHTYLLDAERNWSKDKTLQAMLELLCHWYCDKNDINVWMLETSTRKAPTPTKEANSGTRTQFQSSWDLAPDPHFKLLQLMNSNFYFFPGFSVACSWMSPNGYMYLLMFIWATPNPKIS